MQAPKTNRKLFLRLVATVFCLSIFLIAAPLKPVHAQLSVFDPQQFVETIKEYIAKLKDISWRQAATVALDKAASSFINKLAQDAGNYLATGGKGQSSLVRRESFGSILRKDGEAALGNFVQDLSSETQLDKLGLNLCNPSAQLKANISLQLLDAGQPVPLGAAGCNIRDIQANWQRFAQNAGVVNVNVTTGSQLGISGGAIYGAPTAGTCQTSKGQCVLSGSNASYAGYCEQLSSSSQQLQTYCNTKADCAGGANCIIVTGDCSSNADCKGGSTCNLVSGGSCFTDSDCSGVGARCVGATSASSGVPWLDITKDFSPAEKLKTLNDLFSPQQSDLGAYTLLSTKEAELQAAEEKYKTLDLSTCNAYKDVGSKITDDYVHQNCDEIKALAAKTAPPSTAEETQALKSQGDNGFWLNAAKIFGRSLISGLLKKYIKAGSFSLAQLGQQTDLSQVRENIVQQLRGGVTSPLNALQVTNTLSTDQKPSLDKVDNFDYIATFSQCPDDRTLVELDNCTLDDNFASAIRDKKTVGDALADGTLRGDLPLISDLNTSLDGDPFCVRSGYCHSNIVRLRKYRVLPVGWEIAASLSPIDAPITLQDAVDCFDNNGKCKLDPASNIYYHLIDPNWVLKAPETQCKAMVYGPKPLSTEVAERQQYCADGVSCLAEDDNGTCTGGYGYCTKESNIWRFNGEQCPMQYASCTTYTRTSDKQVFSYLSNSVDTCDASENGCQWYSKSQDNVGTVDQPQYVWNPHDRIYFNKNVATCEADQVGCNEYVSLLTPGVNLVTNGDFDYFTASSSTNFSDPNWMNDTLPDTFDGWQGTANAFTTRDNAYYGSVGLHLQGGGRLSTNVITGILADKTYILSWYAKSASGNDCTTDVSIASPGSPAQSTTVTYTKDWKRFELSKSFDVNAQDTQATISFSGNCAAPTASDMYIDGVKFELNNQSSGFTQYAENGKTYLKSQNQCTKDDVGCDMYTATDSGIKVPGKIDSNDICPAECVGYQNYLELASQYDVLERLPLAPPAPRSVNFIASTAAACPANEVGCEEFTNEQEVAQGGEGKHYFSYVRQCVEDALGSTYYTLEGSDTAGYQVKTWRLLASDLPSGQPCTNVDIGAKNCIDGSTTPATCSAADLGTNLDCREFFDINGNPHYVLQSRVIISSTDCQAYRRTSTGTTFYALGSESRACSAQSNNCREYRGNQSGNLRTVFSDYFEQGTIDAWDSTLSSLSTEAVSTGGHSIVNRNPSDVLQSTLSRNAKSYPIDAGREIYMDFWMKNTGPVQVTMKADASTYFATTTMQVASDWQQYTVGPVYLDTAITATPSIQLTPVGANPIPAVYFDNIDFKESQTNIFLIKDSWKTPLSCDQPIPGAMLGCQEYTNKAGVSYDLRSFTKLCSTDVIGCQAFINTQNSTNPFQKIYNADDPSQVIVPADTISYLVYNEQNRCFSQSKGCSALGSPQLNLNLPEADPKYIDGYKVKTLINNPDTYDNTLCTDKGLFCEEYTNSDSQTVYFKNPRDRVCVYKENQNVNGKIVTGWFQKKSIDGGGTPIGCSDDGVLPIEDKDFQLSNNLDFNYQGWVGECSAQYDQCTEFRDPLDTQGDNALKNADFSLINPANGQPLNWNDHIWSWPYQSTPPANWLQTNPGLRYGISTFEPYGSMSFGQDFSNVDGSDVFAYSVDVNVQKMTHGMNSGVSANLSCHFDSPKDIDFCSTSTWTDPASTCTTTADCKAGGACTAGQCKYPTGNYDYSKPCGPNNSCSGNSMCYTFSWNACEGPGPDGTFNNRADDDFTNMQCAASTPTDDAACAAVPGRAGYKCLSWPYDKTKDRDLVLDYVTNANPYLYNQWQTLRRVVDLGADSGQRNVYECTFWLSATQNQYDQNNTNSSGGACAPAATYAYDLACGDTYCTRPGPDGKVGTADDIPTTVKCSTSTNPALPTVIGDAGCKAAPTGARPGTGDPAAVCGSTAAEPDTFWWTNPLFKKAKSYYYLNNDEIDTKTCNGQVGKKDGCLLFLDMSKRDVKNYSAFASYDKSDGNNGGLVQPVSCAAGDPNCSNDSNTILKVQRDRQCSEWLACRSATEVFDPATNSFRQVCDQVGTCTKYSSGSDILNCAQWAQPSTQRLEYGYYVNRSINFDAADYSGYSIYNDYPVGSLELVDISHMDTTSGGVTTEGPDARNPDYRLVRVVDSCNSTTSYGQPCGPIDPLNPVDKLGRCFATNKCVVGIDGSNFSADSDFVIKRSTRAYAEKDSPFPYSVVESDQGDTRTVKFGFQQAHICDTATASCEDHYYKFQYGAANAITKYFSADVQLSGGAIPTCVCQGGQLDNQECSTKDIEGAFACSSASGTTTGSCQTDADCNKNGNTGQRCLPAPDGKLSAEERCPDNGSPLYLRRSDSFLNWPGFCLEKDNRANINASQTEHACLNWLPVDNAPVGYDFYNQNREAGYSYKAPAYYCLEVGLFEFRHKVNVGCMCSGDCTTGNSNINPDPRYYHTEWGPNCGSCHSWHAWGNRYVCYIVPNGGEGSYPYNGDTIATWYGQPLEDKPDSSCQVLGMAVDAKGENAAMTNFFWSDYKGGAGYAIGDNPIGTSTAPLGYKLGQDDKPFGSAVPTGFGFVTDQLTMQSSQSIPRAGSPYACSSTAASCALWDPINNSPLAIQGWKNPPFVGNEGYTIGVRRLKEIYRKIFNIYRWGNGNTCDNMICGRTDDGPNASGVSPEHGGYFGGQACDPADANSCNNTPGVTSCAPIIQKCVNSVFNNQTNPSSSLTSNCQTCRPGDLVERTPDKRCMSSTLYTDAASCESATLCTSAYPGGACAVDPTDASGRYRCYSAKLAGNDCKIPTNPDGTLIASYLTCNQTTPGQPGTCFYNGEDTQVPCNSVSDCTANDDGDPNNTIGTLAATNKTAYCADNNLEGTYDYGTGSFCLGEPFSFGDNIGNPNAYLFNGPPVHCEGGANPATYTNALGYTLTGPDICNFHGMCLASFEVKNASGALMCKQQPEKGYLPLCNPDIEDCTGLDPQWIIKKSALPLDITASSSLDGLTSVPAYAPYIIPAVCDASGVKCKQSTSTSQFQVPNGPADPHNDNGFSVNDKLGTDATPQNNIIDGFQNLLTSLKFYMASDKNHMPIRYIDLDWGDGLAQTRIGYYKNYMDQCGDPNAFGPKTPPVAQSHLDYAATDQACREAFRNYLHVYAYDPAYTCSRCDNDANRSCGRDEDCAGGGKCDPAKRGIDGAVACYRPRVMLQDNWGWCTNGVYGLTGMGCKDPNVINSGLPPSPPSSKSAYVNYPGIIMVYKDAKP